MMLDGILAAEEYQAIESKYYIPNTTLLGERASLEIDKTDYKTTIKGSLIFLDNWTNFIKKQVLISNRN